MWKIEKVCPIFKQSDKNRVHNYKPVTVISAFAKLFEILLCDRIACHVFPRITAIQLGFVIGRSTHINLFIFFLTILANPSIEDYRWM